MENKKTLVLGATPDPERFANRAANALLKKGHEILLVGKKKGEIKGFPIHNDQPNPGDVHTVTLYVGTRNLPPLFDYILSVKPQRLIFNPGTYHPELEEKASAQGIETVNGCTLVMLASGEF